MKVNIKYRLASFNILVAILFIAGCQTSRPDTSYSFDDPHSYSRPWEARVTELTLDLTVDFEHKVVHGSALWELAVAEGARQLILDINNLDIQQVVLQPGDHIATYSIGEAEPYLGQPLIIDLQPGIKRVDVHYSTRPGVSALDWLEPGQTTSGRYPFMYTQSQPVLARSFFPCQDSPGIRFPYQATVTVPPELMAVMSAVNPQTRRDDGVYHFEMDLPIPSYLVALAVGELEFRPLGSRTGVYAEPALIERAAYEFALTEDMLAAAEALYGNYRWGRYDLLVLPPSFPAGGMENPGLSFISPTVLAGDRSLTDVIAHELAHSWSGNLVTNASWEELWLNEGFTVYFENRIMEKIYGSENEQMLVALSLGELEEEFDREGWDNPDTRLKIDLKGRDPDSAFTGAAYTKGGLFLLNAEQQLGRTRWDRFLNDYFDNFSFQSMSTEKFLEHLKDKLLAGNNELETRLNITEWVYSPGLPDSLPHIYSPVLATIRQQALDYSTGISATQIETADWTTHHWLQFLRQLPDNLGMDRLSSLDRQFDLTHSGNAEILFEWLRLAILNQYTPAYPALETFLTSVGRLKFLIPLYRELQTTAGGRRMASEFYSQARPRYHSVAWYILDPIVGYRVGG